MCQKWKKLLLCPEYLIIGWNKKLLTQPLITSKLQMKQMVCLYRKSIIVYIQYITYFF